MLDMVQVKQPPAEVARRAVNTLAYGRDSMALNAILAREKIAIRENPASVVFQNTGPSEIAKNANRRERRLSNSIRDGEYRFADPQPFSIYLEDSLQKMKILLSEFSRYLDNECRSSIIKQLNFLLAPDGWSEESELPSEESFRGLLALIFYTQPKFPPSIGLSDDGDFLLAWESNFSQISMKIRNENDIQWILQNKKRDEIYSGNSGSGNLLERFDDLDLRAFFTHG